MVASKRREPLLNAWKRINKALEPGDHEAFVFFDRGSRLAFRSQCLSEVMDRATAWVDVFFSVLHGKDTDGQSVVSIGYRTSDNKTVELWPKK